MKGRRIFREPLDPYLSPRWRDPPEPPDDDDEDDMTRDVCGVCNGKPLPNAALCPRCGRTNLGRPVDKASGVVAAKRQDSLDEQFDDRVGRDD